MPLPTKPRIVTETARDDYSARFVLRYRRNWKKMTPEERRSVLLDAADELERYVAQIRDEAAQMTM